MNGRAALYVPEKTHLIAFAHLTHGVTREPFRDHTDAPECCTGAMGPRPVMTGSSTWGSAQLPCWSPTCSQKYTLQESPAERINGRRVQQTPKSYTDPFGRSSRQTRVLVVEMLVGGFKFPCQEHQLRVQQEPEERVEGTEEQSALPCPKKGRDGVEMLLTLTRRARRSKFDVRERKVPVLFSPITLMSLAASVKHRQCAEQRQILLAKSRPILEHFRGQPPPSKRGDLPLFHVPLLFCSLSVSLLLHSFELGTKACRLGSNGFPRILAFQSSYSPSSRCRSLCMSSELRWAPFATQMRTGLFRHARTHPHVPSSAMAAIPSKASCTLTRYHEATVHLRRDVSEAALSVSGSTES